MAPMNENMKHNPQDARILVVEDDANNRLVVTRLLRLAGVQAENIFEVDGDPLQYVSLEQMETMDLIFLDLQLPKKDGYVILKELRNIPSISRVQIVALTANVMRNDVDRARKAGFDGFIGKPIDGRRFSEVLRRLLAGEPVWTVI
jgi:two-component system, cell cycle response regulator DivK